MPRETIYPRPGTHAETVLTYVQSNDGTTTNGIISGLKMNPSVVRKCLKVLSERQKVTDSMDDNGHHHFSAKTPAL